MPVLDINVDVGEGVGNEEKLFPFISSCNLACGAHAGSDADIDQVIVLALRYGIKVGAHPSYPDRANFGREVMLDLSHDQLIESVKQQILKVKSACDSSGVDFTHVKPHGALYHTLNNELDLAIKFVNCILDIEPELCVVGFPCSELERACENKITFIPEGFADRRYSDAGVLVSRKASNAVLTEIDEIIAQIMLMITEYKVKSENSILLPMRVNTICFHGDHYGSAERIEEVSSALKQLGVKIESFV